MRFFQKIFHKIEDISKPCGQIWPRIVLDGVKGSRFQILKARGPGKFLSSRTTGLKVGEMDQIFGKVITGEVKVDFSGPAGGSAP